MPPDRRRLSPLAIAIGALQIGGLVALQLLLVEYRLEPAGLAIAALWAISGAALIARQGAGALLALSAAVPLLGATLLAWELRRSSRSRRSGPAARERS